MTQRHIFFSVHTLPPSSRHTYSSAFLISLPLNVSRTHQAHYVKTLFMTSTKFSQPGHPSL